MFFFSRRERHRNPRGPEQAAQQRHLGPGEGLEELRIPRAGLSALGRGGNTGEILIQTTSDFPYYYYIQFFSCSTPSSGFPTAATCTWAAPTSTGARWRRSRSSACWSRTAPPWRGTWPRCGRYTGCWEGRARGYRTGCGFSYFFLKKEGTQLSFFLFQVPTFRRHRHQLSLPSASPQHLLSLLLLLLLLHGNLPGLLPAAVRPGGKDGRHRKTRQTWANQCPISPAHLYRTPCWA